MSAPVEIDFRSTQANQAAKPFDDKAGEIRSRQTAIGKRFPLLTSLGREARRFDRQADTARIQESRMIDSFRRMAYSPETRIFSEQLVERAQTMDESLRNAIHDILSLPPDDRYLAYKNRIEKKSNTADDFLLNVVDTVSLVLASEYPITATIPVSSQASEDGIYHPVEVRTNLLGIYDLLGINFDPTLLSKPSHQLTNEHELTEFNLSIQFGFIFDREKVLLEGSNHIPYATVTVFRQSRSTFIPSCGPVYRRTQ